jgi:integrase/recombinase XerC
MASLGASAMAGRPSEPWFYVSKNAWYIWLEGGKVSLKVRGEENKADAIKAWHRLMADPAARKAQEAPSKPSEGRTVKEVVKAFLADCEGRVKVGTLRGYRDFLTPFSEKHGKVRADAITSKIAQAYANQPRWSNSTRNGFLSVLSIAFRWAGHPLKVKKPTMESRGDKAIVSDADHIRLMEAAPSYFKPFLSLLRLSGARPSEVAGITAENFDEANGMVRLKEHKTARHGHERIIFLPPEAVAILREQKAKHEAGHLLRNRYGVAYSKNAIVHMMASLRKKTGAKGSAYGYRHGYATDALASGIPDATVAALLGHSNTTMLHRHYSHLTSRVNVLREAASKVR